MRKYQNFASVIKFVKVCFHGANIKIFFENV